MIFLIKNYIKKLFKYKKRINMKVELSTLDKFCKVMNVVIGIVFIVVSFYILLGDVVPMERAISALY